jgi:hypothetical protein
MEAALAKEPVARPQLNTTRFKGSEYERTVWVVTVEEGVTSDDLERPDFWAHVANRMRPFDRIEVRADDGSYFAELLVIAVDRNWAKVKGLMFVQLNEEATGYAPGSADHIVKWRGPHRKWSVVRKSDNAVLKEECQTQAEATLWLNGHLQSR